MKFSEFGLKKDLLSAIRKAGYEEPTPVQEESIPVILEGRDMIGCAQTGTGKTAAFALPVLHKLTLLKRPRVRALVLTPTRELAIQIFDNFKKYGRYLHLRTVCLYGGAKRGPQIGALRRGADILVATPGRLLDFMGQDLVDLSSVEILVLDEADRMLDMGFLPDVSRIVESTPSKRQTLMFSATMEKEVRQLADRMLKDPAQVQVTPENEAADTVEQKLIFSSREDKREIIASLLTDEAVESAIVFTRTKHGADKLSRELKRRGIESVAIHGDKTQGQRQDALNRFKSGKVRVMVATDVAARGLDIPKLSHVFNYDVPEEAGAYIHRIGRTGRAGESGIAITLCCEAELDALREVEELLEKPIPELQTQWSLLLERKARKGKGGRTRHGRSGYRSGGQKNAGKSGHKAGSRNRQGHADRRQKAGGASGSGRGRRRRDQGPRPMPNINNGRSERENISDESRGRGGYSGSYYGQGRGR